MYLHICILLNVHVAVDDKKQYHRRAAKGRNQSQSITCHPHRVQDIVQTDSAEKKQMNVRVIVSCREALLGAVRNIMDT